MDDLLDADVPEPEPSFSIRNMPGITGPLGFFDPLKFSENASEGKLKFYREVELKHGRVASARALSRSTCAVCVYVYVCVRVCACA